MLVNSEKIMKILDLSLTYHWYDMIASGEKKEEYRTIKKFYCQRLGDYCHYKNFDCSNCLGYTYLVAQCSLHEQMCHCQSVAKTYDAVRFHRGQGGKVSMLVECNGIHVGEGKPEWGAVPGEEYFVISLGKILEDNGSKD